MTAPQRTLAAGIGMFCLMTSGFAAYLETPPNDRVQEPPTRIVPPPRPHPHHPLFDLVRAVQPGAPTRYRNVTLFPLILPHARGGQGLATLDDALSHGWITIREQDTASVGELLVRNDSRQAIFLMAGEILTGGKQNRIIKQDALLRAESGFVAVPVYCGEKERWNTGHPTFESGKTMAEPSLRKMAAESESQGAIWQRIDSRMSDAQVPSKTRSYQELYEDEKTRGELDACVSRFRHLCGPRTVGVVAVSGNRIVGCDLFSDADMLSRLWDKLCRSYAVDTLGRDDWREHERGGMGTHDIEHFLNGVLSSTLTRQSTPGAGEASGLSGAVQGNALTWRDDVVHAVLFPGVTILRREMGRPERYRRGRNDHELWQDE